MRSRCYGAGLRPNQSAQQHPATWLLLSVALGGLTLTGCGEPSAEDFISEEVGESSAAVSSLTCVGGVNDELPPGRLDSICRDAPSACAPLRALRQTALNNCAAGIVRVYRVYSESSNLHYEMQHPVPNVEHQFDFAKNPQTGANRNPLYRCINGDEDFITRSTTCEGLNKAPQSFKGYSYAQNTPGARPVHRCRRRTAPLDHFLSRGANCEGHIHEGLIGYAK